jgi:hypothetical protein
MVGLGIPLTAELSVTQESCTPVNSTKLLQSSNSRLDREAATGLYTSEPITTIRCEDGSWGAKKAGQLTFVAQLANLKPRRRTSGSRTSLTVWHRGE